MSNSLLDTEHGSMQAGVDDVNPRRLDGLLVECLNCELDDVPHDAGRGGHASDGGSASTVQRRRKWSGRLFPTEQMDA